MIFHTRARPPTILFAPLFPWTPFLPPIAGAILTGVALSTSYSRSQQRGKSEHTTEHPKRYDSTRRPDGPLVRAFSVYFQQSIKTKVKYTCSRPRPTLLLLLLLLLLLELLLGLQCGSANARLGVGCETTGNESGRRSVSACVRFLFYLIARKCSVNK